MKVLTFTRVKIVHHTPIVIVRRSELHGRNAGRPIGRFGIHAEPRWLLSEVPQCKSPVWSHAALLLYIILVLVEICSQCVCVCMWWWLDGGRSRLETWSHVNATLTWVSNSSSHYRYYRAPHLHSVADVHLALSASPLSLLSLIDPNRWGSRRTKSSAPKAISTWGCQPHWSILSSASRAILKARPRRDCSFASHVTRVSSNHSSSSVTPARSPWLPSEAHPQTL